MTNPFTEIERLQARVEAGERLKRRLLNVIGGAHEVPCPKFMDADGAKCECWVGEIERALREELP